VEFHIGRRDILATAPFEPRSGHVGYVVDKAALGQVSSSASVSPAKQLQVAPHSSSSGTGKIGQ
jgi:hypothetical protein